MNGAIVPKYTDVEAPVSSPQPYTPYGMWGFLSHVLCRQQGVVSFTSWHLRVMLVIVLPLLILTFEVYMPLQVSKTSHEDSATLVCEHCHDRP